ncbi:MAG: hypothetical protein HMLKMBBP_01923 [Planctomycetes bacterium]|nr:hypothetical protein [Planctomycetota bacterium]
MRIAAARAMASVGDRASAPLLHEMLTSKEAVVRAEAVEAIAAVLGAESVGTASAVALGDGAAEPRVAAVRVLGRYPSADGLPRVERCLRDESWSLRVASAEAMAEHGIGDEPARAAAKALVEALAREDRRRVKLALGEALWGLTGIDFGPEPDRWKKWQAEALAGFRPPPRRPVRAQHGAAGSTSGGILDLPIDSEHVCFVLDASSSMNDAVRFGAETTKRAALLAAFGKVLQGLPKPSWINLIPFGTEPMPMKPRLFEATEGGRSAAVKYLGKVAFDGRTNIHDALMLALADDDADTVVLLTDGAPSAGRSTSRTGILDAIRDANRWRLARIHAVELGAANTGARWKGFMEEIARATGGVHLSR